MKILCLILALACAVPAFAQKESLQRAVGTNTVTGSLTSAPFQVATIAALKATSVLNGAVPNGLQVYVNGYYSAGDGGQGYFAYNSASITADNGGTVIAPNAGTGRWQRVIGTFMSPEQFGMVGDGTTDDYPAWKNLVTWMNGTKFSALNFAPNKTYFFGQHIVAGNGVANVIFQSIDGLTINGNGSTIKVQGGFNRAVQSTATLSGLIIYDSTNVRICNLTLNGNNTTITKGGGVAEVFAYGVYIASCTGVWIENVTTSYWITDGIAFNISDVNNPCLACRKVTLVNHKSFYNARQGMSIIQVVGGTFINCEFSYTGQSSYGLHSPAAGVDIEQDRFVNGSPPQQMDANTGMLEFIGCKFYFNQGCTLASSFPDYTLGITYKQCRFEVGVGNSVSSFGFINDCRNVSIESCYFDMQDRGLYATFSSAAGREGYVNFVGNTIKGKEELLRALYPAVPMLIDGNQFISTKDDPVQIGRVLYVDDTAMVFTRNYVFIPAAGYVSEGAGGRCIRLQLANVLVASDNKYATDLLASASGGGGTAHYANSYSEGLLNGVRNEIYVGTAPGALDTIRPVFNRTTSTIYPFSFGMTNAGTFTRFGNQEQARNQSYADAAPTTGTWVRGDIVWNNNAAAGGVPGWYCVTGGTPGTWKDMATIAP